jgi:tetratricopeptide (TPR) repeat protein
MPEAADQYDQVARLGKQIDSGELRIRAWIGHGALAQMRGNYPEQMRYSRRAARLADRLGLRFLSRLAHGGLMITAGARHQFDEAFEHARVVYRASIGDPIHEGEILQNIGQLLLEAGQLSAAADVFASVLSRPLPVRILLPALGGFAIAAAAEGDTKRVQWVRSELDHLEQTATAPPYALASALLECASALSAVQCSADAEQVLAAAVRIAESRGYYEILMRAEALRDARQSQRKERQRTSVNATRLVEEIDVSGAERLPQHVTVIAAPY